MIKGGCRVFGASVHFGEFVHDGEEDGGFVEVVVVAVFDGREFRQPSAGADVVDPGGHDHAPPLGEGFEKFHIVDRSGFLAGGDGLQLLLAETMGVMGGFHTISPYKSPRL